MHVGKVEKVDIQMGAQGGGEMYFENMPFRLDFCYGIG